MGIGKAEAITIRCGHDRAAPIFWALEQTAPACGCIGNNGWFVFGEVGENVLLGTCMSGIIADHKHVQWGIFGELAGPFAVVNAHPDGPNLT